MRNFIGASALANSGLDVLPPRLAERSTAYLFLATEFSRSVERVTCGRAGKLKNASVIDLLQVTRARAGVPPTTCSLEYLEFHLLAFLS